jgi:GT2 family glycosyltransferase
MWAVAVSLSVVIPTHRRPEPLARCLDALARQEYPRDLFEVLVVDNRNPPGTVEPVVRAFEHRLAVRLVTEDTPGPAAARNAGARAAMAPVLAFTDDDCIPDPGWLRAIAEATDAHPDALIGGPALDEEPRGLWTAASRLVDDYFCAQQNADPAAMRFFPSNNLAMAKAAFQAVGGFDTHFPRAAGEDRDFCARWRASGRHLVSAPAARVRHAHPLSMRGFVRQQMNYGRGAFRFHARANGSGPGGVAFYAGLLAHPFREVRTARAAALLGLVLVSQAAVAAGYFSEMAFGGLKGFRSGD